jgi:hypothetical protein
MLLNKGKALIELKLQGYCEVIWCPIFSGFCGLQLIVILVLVL